MSGVGTFSKPCRTLFVGNLLKAQYPTPKDLEDALCKLKFVPAGADR